MSQVLDHFLQPGGYSGSFMHRLDPRVKVVAVVGFVALSTMLTSRTALALAAGFLLVLTAAARLHLRQLVSRLLWLLPFAGIMIFLFPFIIPGEPFWRWEWGILTLTATREGWQHALMLSLRVFAAVLAVNFLMATTGLRRVLEALSFFRVPAVFIQLIEFSIRYIYVVGDELRRMKTARTARGFVPGRHLFHRHTFRTLGQTIAVLFIRSWERGERIYHAMLARGYSGENRKRALPPPGGWDLAWGAFILSVAIGLRLFELGGHIWLLSLK
ncbi:cobalt/nickel transport system permease protein [Desulfofundulus luciae]|uniref:Cobalt/nickel transport system permease protein n=2 Tax=Desulfofundulus luciae TaxID=74702 RepID=A0ABU0B4N8_9FIRM|nr:cobalt/nickel transport system permease protein [Desulfofundulus luciae]